MTWKERNAHKWRWILAESVVGGEGRASVHRNSPILDAVALPIRRWDPFLRSPPAPRRPRVISRVADAVAVVGGEVARSGTREKGAGRRFSWRGFSRGRRGDARVANLSGRQGEGKITETPSDTPAESRAGHLVEIDTCAAVWSIPAQKMKMRTRIACSCRCRCSRCWRTFDRRPGMASIAFPRFDRGGSACPKTPSMVPCAGAAPAASR